jgi:hypothetical protein
VRGTYVVKALFVPACCEKDAGSGRGRYGDFSLTLRTEATPIIDCSFTWERELGLDTRFTFVERERERGVVGVLCGGDVSERSLGGIGEVLLRQWRGRR